MAAGSLQATTVRQPSGRLASVSASARATADSGAASLARRTTVQPAASAGPTPRAGIARGKFQGEMIRQGPTGRRRTTNWQPPSGWPSMRPEIRTASSALHSRYSAAKADLVGGLGQRLARLQAQREREAVDVLEEAVGGAAEHAGAPARRRRGPRGKRTVGGAERRQAGGPARVGHGADGAAGAGVLHRKGPHRRRNRRASVVQKERAWAKTLDHVPGETATFTVPGSRRAMAP